MHTCPMYATFGPPTLRPLYCRQHAAPDMVDLIHPRCEFVGGCQTMNPAFGYPQDVHGFNASDKRRFCMRHALPEMVDLVNKRCEHEGCKVINPNFGEPGSRARFCKRHALEGMRDIKSRRCEGAAPPLEATVGRAAPEATCPKRPNFDVEGGRGRFCKEHSLPGMINVRSRKCVHPGCTTQPNFGPSKQYCKKHYCKKHYST